MSQKWDRLPSVRYTNTHTERRPCLYCIFVQIWALGDNCTKLAHLLAESQPLLLQKQINYLLVSGWFIMLHTSLRSILLPSLTVHARTPGGKQSFWFWTESVVVISPCPLYLFPSYPRVLLTSCFLGNRPSFGTFWAGCSPFISLLAPLQGHNC